MEALIGAIYLDGGFDRAVDLVRRLFGDLITGTDSDLTSLPWVGHRSRKWEPEPFRFAGINSMVLLPIGADRHEAAKGTRSGWREAVLGRLTGGSV